MTTLTGAPTLYLVHITAYDPYAAATTTLRYATGKGFTTTPSETPDSTFYDGRLKQPADITRSIFSSGSTQGRSTVGLGDLVLNNLDGLLDDLSGYAFDGRSVTVYATEVLNPSFPSDFRSMVFTMAGQPVFTDKTITIALRDRLAELTTPFQTTKYAGSNVLPAGLEGVATDLLGKPKPVLYGVGSNLPCPCVNTSKLIYQISDDEIHSVANVYDKGTPLDLGLVWTARTSGFGSEDILAVAFGDDISLWVAVGTNGTLTTATDPTGTWTSRTSGFGASTIRGVARDTVHGYFVAVGDGGKIYRSANGTSGWTVATTPSFGADNVNAIAFGADASGNALLVAAGATGKRATSSDGGDTWTQQTAATGDVKAVGYRAWTSGNQWLTVSGIEDTAAVSDDGGITWSRSRELNSVSSEPVGIASNRLGWVVTVDVGIWRSTSDGFTWGLQNGDVPIANGAAYSPSADLFLAVGDTSIVFSSAGDDRRFWTTETQTATAEDLNAIALASNGLFVAVGDNGALITTTVSGLTYASTTDLLDDALAPVAGTYKAYLGAAGGGAFVRLGSTPAGLVTADATQGANAAARTAGQIWKLILTRKGYSSGTDYSAGDITALDVANSSVCGVWTGLDETDYNTLLSLAGDSVGAWQGPDASGIFRIKQFTAPSGTPVLTITANDLKKPLTQLPTNDPGNGLPVYRCTVRWGKVYAVQDTDLAAGVTDARRGVVSKQWRDAIDTDLAILTSNLLAPETVEESLLTTAADAQTEATRRLTLRKVSRARYEAVVQLNSETSAIDIGSVVELIHPRFRIAPIGAEAGSGALMRVLDVEPDAQSRTVRLTLWGTSAGSINVIGDDGALLVGDDGSYLVGTAA